MIDLVEIKPMFHRARLDQIPLWNVVVVVDHAICEAKGEFWIWIDLGGAEEDHVPQTFGRSVLAAHRIGMGVNTRWAGL